MGRPRRKSVRQSLGRRSLTIGKRGDGTSPEAGDPAGQGCDRKQQREADQLHRRLERSRLRYILYGRNRGLRLTHTQRHLVLELKTTKAPDCPGPSMPTDQNLLQRSVDRRELRVQVGAEAVDDRDDRERDARSNQAVLDGGGARLVLHETRNQVLHKLNSMYTSLVELGPRLTGLLSTVPLGPT